MLLNSYAFELRKRRLGDRIQRLTRGVRHQMNMERITHKSIPFAHTA